jgi:hypothetical protein
MNIFNSKLCLSTTAIVCALSSPQVLAACGLLTDKPFDLTVGVGSTYDAVNDKVSGTTVTRGFTSAADLVSGSSTFSSVNSSYTNTSAAVIRLGYQGLPLVLSTAAGSAAVTLSIPSIGINQTFANGATRDDNIADIKTYLKGAGGSVINQLQNKLAQTSCVNTLVGTPISLASNMVAQDFGAGFTAPASNISANAGTANTAAAKVQGSASGGLVGSGLSYSNFRQGNTSATITSLPLSYSFRSDIDPRRIVTIYAPITMVDVAGAKSYSGSVGGSYRFPINDEWSLSPAVGFGMMASPDLGSVGKVVSGSITSHYAIQMDGFQLGMGNMVGYYQTLKLNAGGYSFDVGVKNTVFKNGILASFPGMISGQKVSYELTYINSYYTGTALSSNQQNEVGITVGTSKGVMSARSSLRAGISYVHSQNGLRGFTANVGYWF